MAKSWRRVARGRTVPSEAAARRASSCCLAAAALAATLWVVGAVWPPQVAWLPALPASGARRRGCTRNGRARSGVVRRGGEKASAPEVWAADWVDAEIARNPVIVFGMSGCSATRAAGGALREAGVRAEVVEVDRMALGVGSEGGPSWPELISAHLAARAGRGVEEELLPAVFIGGEHLREVVQSPVDAQLLRRCSMAGALFVHETAEQTNMSGWIPSTQGSVAGRLQAPKNIGGRRWYQDVPGMAMWPDEAWDEERMEYQMAESAPGLANGGSGHPFTSAGKDMLRMHTNLDKPDALNLTYQYRVMGTIDLAMKFDWGMASAGYDKRPFNTRRYYNVTRAECRRQGLSREQLLWAYKLSRTNLVDELEARQLRHKVLSAVETEDMREVLLDEMRAERRFSPTRLIAPGEVAELTPSQFAKERAADTDTLLLVVIFSPRNPPSVRLAGSLGAAASRLHKATRLVKLNGEQSPEICRELKLLRYPTLLWFEGRSGKELYRQELHDSLGNDLHGEYKKTAMDVSVVEEVMQLATGRARWTPRDHNPADALTNNEGTRSEPLLDLMRSGRYALRLGKEGPEARKQQKEEKGYTPRRKLAFSSRREFA